MNSALADLAEERAAEAFPVQHELLGLPDTISALAAREKRKGGRPAGARNKRAEDVARAVVERLGDPLVHLVAIATADVSELVAQGLDVHQAIVEKRLAAIGALPYLHQRQAVRVDVTGRQVVHLTIHEGGADPIDFAEFSDAVVVELDSGELDGAAKSLGSLERVRPEQLMQDQAASAPSGQVQAHPPAHVPAEGGGPLFGPVAPERAPASVVSRARRIFGANITDPAGEGSGA